MPQRFLKTGITTSPKWNKTSWPAQSLYIRLLTLVDDYGRYDGRASVIWGQCFAVWNEHNPDASINLQQVAQMLQELAGNGLIDLYQFEDKRVIQFTGWTERLRDGVKEKWPIPDSAQKLQEVAGSCIKILPPSPSSPPTSAPAPSPLGLQEVAGKPKRSKPTFTAPTLNEMKSYAIEIQMPAIEVERCFDHYESNGWRVGRSPMKDFKAAMRNWKRNSYANQRNPTHNSRPNTGAEQRQVGIPVNTGPSTYELRESARNKMAANTPANGGGQSGSAGNGEPGGSVV